MTQLSERALADHYYRVLVLSDFANMGPQCMHWESFRILAEHDGDRLLKMIFRYLEPSKKSFRLEKMIKRNQVA